ncbi:MAG TPA: SET domain-containing protein-lysine N-methyltransferase, partial [Terrimicrobiaceae bacterium]
VIVQEFVEGVEYAVDTVSCRGRHFVCDIWRYGKSWLNGAPVYDFNALVRSDSPEAILLSEHVNKALNALGIAFGPAHSEIKLSPNGPVLIESGARMAGTGLALLARDCVRVNQIELTADAYLDFESFDAKTQSPYTLEREGLVVDLICPEPGVVRSVAGCNAVKQLESFYSIHLYVEEGQRVEKTRDIETSPGHVELCHSKSAVLWKDYEHIRGWETNNLLFQLELASTSEANSLPFKETNGKNGLMLEAISFIPKDTVVFDFSHAVEVEQSYQTLQTTGNRHVLCETLAKLNHSCEPSLVVDTIKKECRAARDIQPGDELSFFYPSTEWTMDQPFSCTCSSANCIGTVEGAAFLKARRLKKYWLNRHIVARKQSTPVPRRLLGALRQQFRKSARILRRSLAFERHRGSSMKS